MAETAMTFQDLGLSEAMRKALEKKGYGYPTSVQREAIPPLFSDLSIYPLSATILKINRKIEYFFATNKYNLIYYSVNGY